MNEAPFIYLFSDATGETVETMVDAALTQFPVDNMQIKRVSNLRSANQIRTALETVLLNRDMVVYTMADQELANIVHEECDVRKIFCIDLFTPLLMKLSAYLGCPPRGTPGLLHSVNERYYRRIEAVDFSVKHDDGQELRTLYLADIILIGVSRSSKTPLSMYLANSGWKVANVPIIKGIAPPEELFSAAHNRVVCLTIDPQRLLELRIARLRNLHQSTDSVYANLEEIIEELAFVKSLCKKQGWPMVDVSEKAVEETANDILTKLRLK
ncbi:MAG: kinase/pyrophosphorylase [Deltaproteobacteria bacterium]|nr:kinase/pyrophosphorylase [Deltaproteobacteria bacterium]